MTKQAAISSTITSFVTARVCGESSTVSDNISTMSVDVYNGKTSTACTSASAEAAHDPFDDRDDDMLNSIMDTLGLPTHYTKNGCDSQPLLATASPLHISPKSAISLAGAHFHGPVTFHVHTK